MRAAFGLLAQLGLLVVAVLAIAAPSKAVSGPSDDGFLWVTYPQTLGELVSQADAIALVRIGTQQARLIAEQGRLPGAVFTDSAASVVETYKGALPAAITIMQTGGRYGSHEEGVPSDPVFQPGTLSLVFLTDISNDPVQGGPAKFRAVAPSGRFDVVNGRIVTRANEAEVSRSFSGAALSTLETAIRRLH